MRRFGIVVALTFAAPTPAMPCSTLSYTHPQALPLDGGTVNESPLIMDGGLRDSNGLEVALTEITVGPLAAVSEGEFDPMTLLVPEQPLNPGVYTVYSGDYPGRQFTVDPTNAPGPPTLAELEVTLVLDELLSSSGCLSGNSCDGVTVTRLEFDPTWNSSTPGWPDGSPNLLVRLQTDDAEYTTILGIDAYNGRAFLSPSYDTRALAFDTTRTCITVYPLSTSGEVGAAYDAGCIDPNDPDDPRVERHSGSGCQSAPTHLLYFLFALWILRSTHRRRLFHLGGRNRTR